jgi:UDP-2,3-diacylglucosamine hydrolase
MSTAVIADAHIGGPGGPPAPLIRQLEELGDGPCRRLILLGDLFHVWVGDRRYETPEIRSVVEALGTLKEKGVRLDYVEGNRDFFIGRGPYAELFDQVGSEVVFTAGGKRYLAVHGDGLNDADYMYRFWHWLSKSPLSRFMMHNLPGPLARTAVHQTEHQLAKTNFKHKSHIPEKVILEYAERRLGTDYDVLVLGHFHEPKTWQVSAGEVHLLDAWYRSQRVEWFAES